MKKNPLVVAIKSGELKKVVSILSQSDCDPNTVDAEKSTPLHLAAGMYLCGCNFLYLQLI